jgi:chorismate mutase
MSDFKKFPKIKRIGDDENSGILESGQLVIQEKMDGANFRFTYDPEDERLVFGSRNVEYWNEKDIDKNFTHAVDFVRDNIDLHALRHIDERHSMTFFGEAMHAHTLDYRWEEVPSFLGFAIWDEYDELFLPWSSTEKIFDGIGLPTVPVRYTGWADRMPEAYEFPEPEIGDSEYRDGVPEGIVIWNQETNQIAKYRTEQFKERHGSQSVSNPDDYEPDDSVVLARQYTTEARVLKMIHKYRDRGRDIEMAMMEDLWRDIFDDIIEEEYDEIFLGNHVIDTKKFRSEVASITADVLQQYLSRPDGSALNEVEL